jgi:hypothetical protein
MNRKILTLTSLGLVATTLLLSYCDAAGEEPSPVYLPVEASSAGLGTATNDLGWAVEVSTVRIAISNLELTIEGETHASLPRRLLRLAIGEALAHPGHYAGGTVTGELRGDYLLELPERAGDELGTATLLPGAYHGVNLWFRAAGAADELAPDDPLLGHGALLAGTASRDAEVVAFEARLDLDPATQMVGGPFDLVVDESTVCRLGLTVYTIDPSEGDTFFDGIDFGALDDDGDGQLLIEPGTAAHNVLAKALVRHDHWGLEVK